ncbi:MAG: bifunctional glutamate N-acetyltransferase/amino-acid acetyltransferase ArgJ [Thermodesulfovibrionales bacterium]
MENTRTILIPRGYLFATAEAAIKRPGRKDIALIVSALEATMAGTFTRNRVKAAPVRLCMERIRTGKGQAIVVNSGNANACTGHRGLRDAEATASLLAKATGIAARRIYPCSTGVIGMPMPMDRVKDALPLLVSGIGKARFEDVAAAIMTTDTFPKIFSARIRIGKTTGTIAGVCKGAGMIAPNMATMLCFILTDLAVERRSLSAALRSSVQKTFNRITIDGDMSTNDTVLCMANGAAGNKELTADSRDFGAFRKGLDRCTSELARLIVTDGEGATKFVTVRVQGCRKESDAERAALSIANSNLVKTAIYGNDANWGRIMAALGYSGVAFSEETVDVKFNNVLVVRKGISNNRDSQATAALRGKELRIVVDLHDGAASADVLTCDFSEDYVRINAEYRT